MQVSPIVFFSCATCSCLGKIWICKCLKEWIFLVQTSSAKRWVFWVGIFFIFTATSQPNFEGDWALPCSKSDRDHYNLHWGLCPSPQWCEWSVHECWAEAVLVSSFKDAQNRGWLAYSWWDDSNQPAVACIYFCRVKGGKWGHCLRVELYGREYVWVHWLHPGGKLKLQNKKSPDFIPVFDGRTFWCEWSIHIIFLNKCAGFQGGMEVCSQVCAQIEGNLGPWTMQTNPLCSKTTSVMTQMRICHVWTTLQIWRTCLMYATKHLETGGLIS